MFHFIQRFLEIYISTGETVGRWAGSNASENQVEQAASNTVSAGQEKNVQTLFLIIA